MAPLYHTFELYLRAKDALRPQFEALTCPSMKEVLPQVRQLIAERGLESVEVRQSGRHLFTVSS